MTILMKHHTLFFRKLGKMLQNLSSAAVVIGALNLSSNIVFQNSPATDSILARDKPMLLGLYGDLDENNPTFLPFSRGGLTLAFV